jgi:hypothetical protein
VTESWHGGSFNGFNSMFRYNMIYFDGPDGPEGAMEMMWHELRHGEQFFQGLRYALGREQRGISPPGQTGYLGIVNPTIIDAATNAGFLDDSTPEGRWAAMFADAAYTTAGQQQLGWAASDQNHYGDRYPQTPFGGDVRRRIDINTDDVVGRPHRCVCEG